jgi:hypothetical protein
VLLILSKGGTGDVSIVGRCAEVERCAGVDACIKAFGKSIKTARRTAIRSMVIPSAMQHVVLRYVARRRLSQFALSTSEKKKAEPSRQRRSVDNKSARCASSKTTHKKSDYKIVRRNQTGGAGVTVSQTSA